jgi:hypothetical protein
MQMVWIEVIASGSDWVRTPVQRRAQAILIAAETLRLQPPYLLAATPWAACTSKASPASTQP